MTLLWFTVGFTAAALFGVYLPWTVWILPAGIAGLAAWLVLRRMERGRIPRLLLLGAALSLLWLTAYGLVFHAPAEALENRTVRMEAVVTNWPEETDYGVRIPVKAGEEDGRKVHALLYLGRDYADLRPGDRISCVAHCSPADRFRGQDSLYYPSKGVLLHIRGYGEITVTQPEHFPLRYAPVLLAEKTRAVIDRLYPEGQAGFLHALLTGDKTGLDNVARTQFNRVGVAHVVVISGLHVSFLAGFLTLFLKPQKRGPLIALLVILVLFSMMTGNAPGTVRAAILSGMGLIAAHLKRQTHSLTALCTGLLVLLLANPYSIAAAGLQFSFLATLGIFVFGQRWSRNWAEKLPKRGRRRLKLLTDVVAISLGSMLFTIPLSALYFGQFSLIAPVSNLLTSWSVSFAFLGGMLSVLVGAVCTPIGQALGLVVGLPIRFFLWYAQQASKISLAALTTDSEYYMAWAGFVYLLFAIYLLSSAKEKRPILPVCACVITLCLSALLTAQTVRQSDLTLTALDVGQGQSVAVLSGDCAALIDCGGTSDPGDTAATYLQSLGRTTVDLLVLTHFHDDHAGGVPALMGRMKVNTLAVPDVDGDSELRKEIERLAEEQGTEVHYITNTSTVTLGGTTLTLCAPAADSGDSNEQCLSVLCSCGGWDALLTGDMPIEAEQELLRRENLPDIELLVAGHHGSKYSTGEELLAALRPEAAIISVGQNTYGHPTPETLERLAAAGAEVYRTDERGSITVYASH